MKSNLICVMIGNKVMLKQRIILIVLMMFVQIAASDYSEAATPITITTTGPGAYSISAADLPDAAGVDLSITYNKAFLKDPVVTAGALTSSAMMASNIATPGFIRIAFVTGSSIKGSGVLASISFTKIADPAPQPILATPGVYSAAGAQITAQAISADPSQPSAGSKGETDTVKDTKENGSKNSGAGSTTVSTGGVSTATTQISTVPGSVSLPQETGTKNELVRQDSRKDPLREEPSYQAERADSGSAAGRAATDRPAAADAVVVTEDKTTTMGSTLKSSQSVLERFRSYKDIRSMKRLSNLFDERNLQTSGIVQSPAISVSDGKTLVTVAVDLANEADTPNFSLKGANLKSIRRVSSKKWELDALPQKGRSDVRLSIILKGERIEIPLVVVPPLHQAGEKLVALPVAALDALLAKPLKNSKPAYDLNSDGMQDYVDDYILVAHWLLKQQRAVGKKPAADGK
jgi:hypothetical protein